MHVFRNISSLPQKRNLMVALTKLTKTMYYFLKSSFNLEMVQSGQNYLNVGVGVAFGGSKRVGEKSQ